MNRRTRNKHLFCRGTKSNKPMTSWGRQRLFYYISSVAKNYTKIFL